MPTKEKVRIEYMSLEKLKRWPRNAKDHDLGEIHQSLSRFGYVAPILIDERSKKIVAGHGRLDSLLSMKDDGQKPPGRIVSKNGSWFVPVIRGVRFSSDREAEGYLLADNRLTEVGGWHEDVLAEVLSEFAKEDKLDGLGWDADDVDEIVKGIQAEPREAPEAQIDKADELQKKWKTKTGQLWQIGQHRLLIGDATKAEDVARMIGGEKAGVLVTDPPYGINLDTSGGKRTSKLAPNVKAKTYASVYGDDKPFDASKVFGCEKIKEQFWFGANYYAKTLGDTELSGSWLVWDKRKESQDEGFGSCFELIWSREKHKQIILRHEWFGFLSGGDKEACNRFHPTQKPSQLIMDILTRWTKGIVYDPFLGSGTTMVAAEQLTRICYGMEIEPKYCAVTLERMSDMGLKPKLMS